MFCAEEITIRHLLCRASAGPARARPRSPLAPGLLRHDPYQSGHRADVGPFAQQHIDWARWIEQQLLEQASLATMTPDVAGVEKALSTGLHQQRVRVEATVVGQVRRNREGTHPDRHPVVEETRRMERHPGRAEELGLGQQQRCLPTDVDGNARSGPGR